MHYVIRFNIEHLKSNPPDSRLPITSQPVFIMDLRLLVNAAGEISEIYSDEEYMDYDDQKVPEWDVITTPCKHDRHVYKMEGLSQAVLVPGKDLVKKAADVDMEGAPSLSQTAPLPAKEHTNEPEDVDMESAACPGLPELDDICPQATAAATAAYTPLCTGSSTAAQAKCALPSADTPNNKIPIHYFRYFLDTYILDYMVRCTNDYAKAFYAMMTERLNGEEFAENGKGAELLREMKPWTPVTRDEMTRFIGVFVYMACYPLVNECADFWNKNPRSPIYPVRNAMTHARFEQIRRVFHVSMRHHLSAAPASSPWVEVEALSQTLVNASERCYVPSSNMSVEEMTVGFHRHVSPCQLSMYSWKERRIDTSNDALKIFCLTDEHGFSYNWSFCSRASNIRTEAQLNAVALPPLDKPLTATSMAVLKQVAALPQMDGTGGGTSRYTLFLDSYFASVPLFAALRKLGVAAVGTARQTSREFPKQLFMETADRAARQEVADLTVAVAESDDGAVLAVNMQTARSAHVNFLTTAHTWPLPAVTPCAEVSEESFAALADAAPPPGTADVSQLVADYNAHLGRVPDKMGKALRDALYKEFKTTRSWMPLFCWLLDTAVSNAYLLAVAQGHRTRHVDMYRGFRVSLGAQLMLVGAAAPAPVISTRMPHEVSSGSDGESGVEAESGDEDSDGDVGVGTSTAAPAAAAPEEPDEGPPRKKARKTSYVKSTTNFPEIRLTTTAPHLLIKPVARKQQRDCYHCLVKLAQTLRVMNEAAAETGAEAPKKNKKKKLRVHTTTRVCSVCNVPLSPKCHREFHTEHIPLSTGVYLRGAEGSPDTPVYLLQS